MQATHLICSMILQHYIYWLPLHFFMDFLCVCVIGASLKVWDRFPGDYFKLFIPMFIKELLSIHYNIGLCKTGREQLAAGKGTRMCVWVWVCLGLSGEGFSVCSFDCFGSNADEDLACCVEMKAKSWGVMSQDSVWLKNYFCCFRVFS